MYQPGITADEAQFLVYVTMKRYNQERAAAAQKGLCTVTVDQRKAFDDWWAGYEINNNVDLSHDETIQAESAWNAACDWKERQCKADASSKKQKLEAVVLILTTVMPKQDELRRHGLEVDFKKLGELIQECCT